MDSLQLPKKRTEGRGRGRGLRASLAHWISLQSTLTPRGFWRGLKVGSQDWGLLLACSETGIGGIKQLARHLSNEELSHVLAAAVRDSGH